MQRAGRLSASAGPRLWHLPPDRPPTHRSDLGSDDEWQLTMGSDSDVDSPSSARCTRSRPRPPPNSTDGALASIQWNDDDEERFVEDVAADSTLVAPHPASAPARAPAAPTAPLTQPVPDEYELDDHDHLSLIPGFRGVASRASLPDSVPPNLSVWDDRPRPPDALFPLQSELADYEPHPVSSSTSPESSSHRAAPPITPDSAPPHSAPTTGPPSPAESPAAPRQTSPPSSSDTSDPPTRPTQGKTVSFLPPSDLDSETTRTALHSADMYRASPTHSAAPSSARSSGSLKAERKVSGLRMSLRDGRPRLGGPRLPKSRRGHRRGASSSSATTPPLPLDGMSERALSSDMSGAEHNGMSSGAGEGRQLGRPVSTQSDGITYARQESGLSSTATGSERPMSTPQQGMDSVLDSRSTSAASDVFFAKAPVTIPSFKQRYHIDLKPVSKDLSFLECVVEVLKGATVFKRKNFMHANEALIWLTPDMQTVKFRTTKKGCAAVTHELPLQRVKKLKGTEREITIEMMEAKKPLEFLFPSRERAEMWLSGLCCLVPSHASVKSRNRRLGHRDSYDPLLDTWNGKPLSSRKRLADFILLGSIGRGSFGKVKLALSVHNRQFYAVKVLSKAMMRKRMRSTPFDRKTQEGLTAQLTISDVNEIAVMKELEHENVMRLMGVFDDVEEDRLYIVVEFLAKGTIMSSSELTGVRPLGEERARSVFVDVLAGLEYLHYKNVVHRDIKPDNLLGTGDGTVKISDFGAAVSYNGKELSDYEEYRSHSTVGTPAFTAPELCVSDHSPECPQRCFAADIWSLGATLFYMVYGRAPFIARSVFEMYDAICTQDLVFPETPVISKNLQSLIEKMLDKVPEKRATVATILKSSWLTEGVDVTEKLAKIREALRMHSRERDGAVGYSGDGRMSSSVSSRT